MWTCLEHKTLLTYGVSRLQSVIRTPPSFSLLRQSAPPPSSTGVTNALLHSTNPIKSWT